MTLAAPSAADDSSYVGITAANLNAFTLPTAAAMRPPTANAAHAQSVIAAMAEATYQIENGKKMPPPPPPAGSKVVHVPLPPPPALGTMGGGIVMDRATGAGHSPPPDPDVPAHLLNLGQLFIGPAHCIVLARMLIVNHHIRVLNISACDLGPDATQEFFGCLARNHALRQLNVAGNFLDENSALHFSEYLAGSDSLESACLSCNRIGDKGAEYIAGAIAKNKKLSFLDVRGNNITDVGAQLLCDALDPAVNTALTALWFNLNCVSQEVGQSITDWLIKKCPPPPETAKKGKKGKGKKK
jgi:hypothetical protein